MNVILETSLSLIVELDPKTKNVSKAANTTSVCFGVVCVVVVLCVCVFLRLFVLCVWCVSVCLCFLVVCIFPP